MSDEDLESAATIAKATTPAKKSATKKPKTQVSAARVDFDDIDLDEIKQELNNIYEDFEEDMRLVTVLKKDVTTVGFGPVKFNDILVLQITLPPGGVLETLRIEINEEDPTNGTVSIDEDPNTIKGSKAIKNDWRKLNTKLSNDIEASLDLAWKEKYGVKGTTPLRGKIINSFTWPEGAKSQLNPLDPFVLGLRSQSTQGEQSLFELKTMTLSSKSDRVVSIVRLTAFFLVEKHTHINNAAGRGLKINDASDSDSDASASPRRKKRNRQRGSQDGGEGNHDNGGDGYDDGAMSSN